MVFCEFYLLFSSFYSKSYNYGPISKWNIFNALLHYYDGPVEVRTTESIEAEGGLAARKEKCFDYVHNKKL